MLSVDERMIMWFGHVIWLCKTSANPEKVCKQLFLLGWDSRWKAWWPGVTKIIWVGWILGRMSMTLQSLETYGYIDSKTKSYQIQKRFLLLFIFLSYFIRLCLSGLAFLLPPNLSSGFTWWVTPPSFAITLIPNIAKVLDPRFVKAIK